MLFSARIAVPNISPCPSKTCGICGSIYFTVADSQVCGYFPRDSVGRGALYLCAHVFALLEFMIACQLAW